MAHLENGGGFNGTFALGGSNVQDDGDKDTLTGGAAVDWFFVNLDTGVKDTITDKKNIDFVKEMN